MNLQFVIYTTNDFTEGEAFKAFLAKGIEGPMKLAKYDYKEPVKQQINNIEEVLTILTDYGNVILKGANKALITASHNYYVPTTIWRGHPVLKAKGTTIADVISLIEILANDNKILFGGLYTEDEYDAKHKIVKQYSYGWRGVSHDDFMKCIPGVYWYTIFGKELTDTIGTEKLNNLPGVVYTNPGNGCVAFHLDEPIESDDLEGRLAKEEALAKMIGRNYFFEKGNPEDFRHPKVFLEFLKHNI